MLDQIKLNTSELEVGMYVSSLDRPWIDTPFLLQGFRIESPEDISRLQKYCHYVYIDRKQSIFDRPLSARKKMASRPRLSKKELLQGRRLKVYEDTSDWATEYPQAQVAVEELSLGVSSIFESAEKGSPLDVVKVKQSVDPMIDSVIRNPDACIWLARMKQEDQYTYRHSLGAAIWSVALGRQLGLPRSDLRSLAIGGVLFDVGKLQVDKEILHARRTLTEEEFEQVRAHVALGLQMVESSGVMNRDVLDMVASHHERHDGSGYPRGLHGMDIPIFARIAAIVDCYDAITSHRSYARAVPPSEAIKLLYEWRDVDFQAELVEEFIQAIGIYPAGSLVELSSGEVAVVISEYRTRRLRPKVMILLDSNKTPLSDLRVLDLRTQQETSDGRVLEIVTSLEPEAYGIDMNAMQL